ncbi:hypothetical protein L2E82_28149 [Cichorium intybus]|uniref:Uncharacterized protein n=1 Tax=Cichorium intybus TaxID=13427 RepID=A0ACB9CV43_CICIN|nr:hypothetical protein L2E82_28149 [Cichorium intybus]
MNMTLLMLIKYNICNFFFSQKNVKRRIFITILLCSITSNSNLWYELYSWTVSVNEIGGTARSTRSDTVSKRHIRFTGQKNNWVQNHHSISMPECLFSSPIAPPTTTFGVCEVHSADVIRRARFLEHVLSRHFRQRVEAVEVHRKRREHGQGRYQDASEQVVGYLQRRDLGLLL